MEGTDSEIILTEERVKHFPKLREALRLIIQSIHEFIYLFFVETIVQVYSSIVE